MKRTFAIGLKVRAFFRLRALTVEVGCMEKSFQERRQFEQV